MLKLADGVAGLSHILRRVRNNNTAIGGIIRVWHHATIKREQIGMSMGLRGCFFLRRATTIDVEHKLINGRIDKSRDGDYVRDDVHVRNNTNERQPLPTNNITKKKIK